MSELPLQPLREFIEQARLQGKSESEITSSLLEAGWNQQHIQAALVDSGSISSAIQQSTQNKYRFHKLWIWGIVGALALFLIFFVVKVIFSRDTLPLRSVEAAAQLAIEKQDPAICESVGYSSCANGYPCRPFWECYQQVAAALNDVSLCSKTADDAACVIQLSKSPEDISYCDEVTPGLNYETECYQGMAVKYHQSSLCLKNVEVVNQAACLANYVYRTPDAEITVCEQVPLVPDTQFTPEKITPTSYRDGCYRSLAKNRRDSSICNKIVREDYKRSCRENVIQ